MTRTDSPDAPLYKTSSGLGGSFIVRIVERQPGNRVLAQVQMNNPDWNGYRFITRLDQLTEYRQPAIA